MKKSFVLCFAICSILLFTFKTSSAQVYPALGTSFSITPNAQVDGSGNNLYYDFSSSLGIPFHESWSFTPGYALGFNSLNSVIETFSTLLASLRYSISDNWRIRPSFADTFSHSSTYNSQRARLCLTYLFPEPSTISVYAGPSYFRDSDQSKKIGGFGGISGNFMERWFGYGDLSIGAKTNSDSQTSLDHTLTLGTGYDITEKLSFSIDMSIFRGASGLSVNQTNSTSEGSASIEILSKRKNKSKTINQNQNTSIRSTEITWSIAADYNF